MEMFASNENYNESIGNRIVVSTKFMGLTRADDVDVPEERSLQPHDRYYKYHIGITIIPEPSASGASLK